MVLPPGLLISLRRRFTRSHSRVVDYPTNSLRPVGIANPCVVDKPLMPYPAVWTVGTAEKYRGVEQPGFDVSVRGDCRPD
jgi:hypothetical protein